MKQLLLIGIGPGDPRQITFEAVDAMRRATVFFMIEKGGDKEELARMRKDVLARYLPHDGYRIVRVTDPCRDGSAQDYISGVQDWHRARANLYRQAMEHELHEGDIGAFLLWGEPTLYDSTLRVLDLVREQGMALKLEVIPGISSVQALAARHCLTLNRIGEPLTVLPARRLAELETLDNVVVMLDGHATFAELDDPNLTIYWGAYLGTADEILMSGPLMEVKAQIVALRLEARRRKGWIMDTYLLRREG